MPDTGKLEGWIYENQQARARGEPTLPFPAAMPSELTEVIFAFGAFALVIFGLHWLYSGLLTTWSILPSLARHPAAWVGAAVGALIVGGVLYLLKLRYLLVYASLELAVAAATASSAISHLADTKQNWTFMLAFFGSVYVAVRGFSNLGDAIPKLSQILKP